MAGDIIANAEVMCVAAALARPAMFDRISDGFGSADLRDPWLRTVFAALERIAAESDAPSFESGRVALAMGASPFDGEVLARIDQLAACFSSTLGLDAAVKTVKAAAVQRQLAAAAAAIGELAQKAKLASIGDAVAESERMLQEISIGPRASADVSLKAGFNAIVAECKDKRDGKPDPNPLMPTGITMLDGVLKGLRPGFMHIIGARPKVGKTALAVQMALAVMLAGRGVVYQSTEVQTLDVHKRAVGNLARVRAEAFDSYGMPDHDEVSRMLQVGPTAATLGRWMLAFDDPQLNIAKLARNVRRYKRMSGAPPLGLVVFDQINDAAHVGNVERRDLQIAQISGDFRDLLREWNVPGLLLCQLSRGLESRPNKRPLPSDLRDSGALEAQAGVVMFLYRDVVHNEKTKMPHLAEIAVALNRRGPTGTAYAKWDGQLQRFDDVPASWGPPSSWEL